LRNQAKIVKKYYEAISCECSESEIIVVDSTEFVPHLEKNKSGLLSTETLTSYGVKHLTAALPRLARHVRDVMMLSAGFTRAGVFLNLVLLLILVNPLLAKSTKTKEKGRQQQQEERQTEFVKGKSKKDSHVC
jgi:hypothetical protein